MKRWKRALVTLLVATLGFVARMYSLWFALLADLDRYSACHGCHLTFSYFDATAFGWIAIFIVGAIIAVWWLSWPEKSASSRETGPTSATNS